MDLINPKFCYNLSTLGDGSIMDWSGRNSSRIVQVQPIHQAPLSFHRQLDEHNYQICGVLMLFCECFSMFSKIKVKILEPVEAKQVAFDSATKEPDELPDIYLLPLFIEHVNQIIQAPMKPHIGLSSIVAQGYPDQILAKTRKGESSIFEYIYCFDNNIYLAIICSVILNALMLGLMKKSTSSFFSTMWSYASVILSDCYAIPVKTLTERLLSGIWLMSCTVLLAAFSGQLREQMLKPKPIHWIDSWQDLYEWKEITKINTLGSTLFTYYANEYKEEMALNFKERISIMSEYGERVMTYNETVLGFDGIRRGESAIVYIKDFLNVFKLALMDDGFVEDIDFHISKEGGIPQPSYFMINKFKLNKFSLIQWNLVVGIMRESGITNYHFDRMWNPKNIPRYDRRMTLFTNEMEDIKFDHFEGSFYFYIVFNNIAIILVIFESIKRIYH